MGTIIWLVKLSWEQNVSKVNFNPTFYNNHLNLIFVTSNFQTISFREVLQMVCATYFKDWRLKISFLTSSTEWGSVSYTEQNQNIFYQTQVSFCT